MLSKAKMLAMGILGGGASGVIYGEPQTLTLQPDGTTGTDNMILSGAATANFGTNAAIRAGERSDSVDSHNRTLIKFDLSTIPAGSLIDSATLRLKVSQDLSSNARTFRVYRLKRAWTEAGSTWNKYDGTNDWQTAGAFGTNDAEQTDIGATAFSASETVGTVKNFVLSTSAIQEMIAGGTFTNNGFLVKADTELDDMYGFYSSDDATAGNRPILEVVYRPPF